MSEQIREQISALLDGELPAAERQLLLERLSREPALRAHWGRYQLIGDALRKGLASHVDTGLADRVMAELEAEPVYHGHAGTALARLVKPLAGLAVAASVAVVAVLAVQQARAPDTTAVQVATTAAPAMPGPDAYKRVRGTHWDVDAPQVGNRLNELLVNHNEYAASSGMPGIPPYVRIVGYDQE